MRLALTLVLIIFLSAGTAWAQSYHVSWSSINSGGGAISGGDYQVICSIGQATAGFSNKADLLQWIGFWSGEMSVPTVVSAAGSAKLLPDGTFVSVAGKIAASAVEDFDGFLYVQESDRSSGIRVACASWPVADLFRGSVVSVIGTMGTTSAGERQITGSIVIVGAPGSEPRPLGMNNRAIGGAGLGSSPGQWGVAGGIGTNNVGLLVQTWGSITGSGDGYLVLDDGSALGIRVDTTGLADIPTSGCVTVVGISSMFTDMQPCILPRGSWDIR